MTIRIFPEPARMLRERIGQVCRAIRDTGFVCSVFFGVTLLPVLSANDQVVRQQASLFQFFSDDMVLLRFACLGAGVIGSLTQVPILLVAFLVWHLWLGPAARRGRRSLEGGSAARMMTASAGAMPSLLRPDGRVSNWVIGAAVTACAYVSVAQAGSSGQSWPACCIVVACLAGLVASRDPKIFQKRPGVPGANHG